MSDTTARLALPMIAPGQAQKEMSHNEALALIDVAVQASVVAFGTESPPSDPAVGQCWIIGAAPAGDWSGYAGQLAAWTAGGWRFVQPTPGFRVWVIDAAVDAQFIDGEWNLGTIAADRLILAGDALLSTPAEAIDAPSGGATTDAQARVAIDAILAALRHHNLVRAA